MAMTFSMTVTGVTGGVDTHADVHVAAAVCSSSHRLLASASFPANPRGYGELLEWLGHHGVIDRVGVEGTGSYGAGLARFLAAESVEVVEVDRPDRRHRARTGKSDAIDAEAAARAVLAGRATGVPKTRDAEVEAIRMLQLVYRSAVRDRTAAIQQFQAILLTAPDSVRDALAGLNRADQLRRTRRWRDRAGDDVVVAAARRAMHELARRVGMLTEQAETCERQLTELVQTAAPALNWV